MTEQEAQAAAAQFTAFVAAAGEAFRAYLYPSPADPDTVALCAVRPEGMVFVEARGSYVDDEATLEEVAVVPLWYLWDAGRVAAQRVERDALALRQAQARAQAHAARASAWERKEHDLYLSLKEKFEPDDPAQSSFYDLVPERTVEEMAARSRARQARRADAQRLYVDDDDQTATPTDPALIQVLSRGSILSPDA